MKSKRERKAEARRAVEVDVSRRVELRIEGYLAKRSAEMRGLDKPDCGYVGWEAEAWESGWRIASQDAGRW